MHTRLLSSMRDCPACWRTAMYCGTPWQRTKSWKPALTGGCKAYAPECALVLCAQSSSAICAHCSTRCVCSKTPQSKLPCAVPHTSVHKHTYVPCNCAHACCARVKTCANTTLMPNCCTPSGSRARSTPPMARLWLQVPMPVCCITVPT